MLFSDSAGYQTPFSHHPARELLNGFPRFSGVLSVLQRIQRALLGLVALLLLLVGVVVGPYNTPEHLGDVSHLALDIRELVLNGGHPKCEAFLRRVDLTDEIVGVRSGLLNHQNFIIKRRSKSRSY